MSQIKAVSPRGANGDIPLLDHREKYFFIPGPNPSLRLFLRYLPAKQVTEGRPRNVLYVHGATFPSALSIAHRFDGRSWRDELNDAGFNVWGLDFYGFGFSDRYAEMDELAELNPPLCTTTDAAEQLRYSIEFILAYHAVARLSIIAHSWGTIPTCRFAGDHPELVERLVLFGPIAQRQPLQNKTSPILPAWRVVTVEDQWKRFIEDVPDGAGSVLSRTHFSDWATHYLDSDARSRTLDPTGVKVPNGPVNDISCAWHGLLGYDPALVQAPVALVRGEWDGVVPDRDARWLFDALTASSIKRDVKISRATHLMHLETMRFSLYRESINFLLGNDMPTSMKDG